MRRGVPTDSTTVEHRSCTKTCAFCTAGLKRIIEGMNNSESPAMPDVKPAVPWFESNLFWGPVALVAGLILTALANHNLRWLLWLAWPCTVLVVVWLAKRTREFWPVAVMGAILNSAALFYLYLHFKPSPAPAVATVQPAQTPPPSQPKPVQQTGPSTVPTPRSPSPPTKKPQHPATQAAPSLPVPTVTQPQPPVTIASAPNGIAITGGNVNQPTVLNQPNVNVFAPIKRHLDDNQRMALSSEAIRNACYDVSDSTHPYIGIDIRWEPTPEAAGYAQDFITSLGKSVFFRAPLEANGEEATGLLLLATVGEHLNGCAQALKDTFDAAGVRYALSPSLQQRYINPVPPVWRPHQPPNSQPPVSAPRKPAPPETVILVGTN